MKENQTKGLRKTRVQEYPPLLLKIIGQWTVDEKLDSGHWTQTWTMDSAQKIGHACTEHWTVENGQKIGQSSVDSNWTVSVN